MSCDNDARKEVRDESKQKHTQTLTTKAPIWPVLWITIYLKILTLPCLGALMIYLLTYFSNFILNSLKFCVYSCMHNEMRFWVVCWLTITFINLFTFGRPCYARLANTELTYRRKLPNFTFEYPLRWLKEALPLHFGTYQVK